MEINLIKRLKVSRDHNNVLFIGGPTASGKTSLAIKVAQEFIDNGQATSIISADSRQIYTGMTICSAKPVERSEERINKDTYKNPIQYQGVDHYLFDIKHPDQRYTLFDFKNQTEEIIKRLHQKGHKVIVAGGTGLYVDSVVNNYQQSESTQDESIKEQLLKDYKEIESQSSKQEANLYFWNILNESSIEEAKNIDKNNWQGVLRALEVQYVSKQNKSSLSSKSDPNFEIQMIILDPPREELYEHINNRCEIMLSEGLVDETKTLLENYSKDLPSMTSIGYREITQYLEGQITKEEALQKFQKATRNYAKRQLTWFRRYKDYKNTQFIDSYKLLK